MSRFTVMVLRLLMAVSGLSLVAAQSSNATAKINWTGSLSHLSGGLAGNVKVLSSTSILITGYTLQEASAPTLYWWGSTTDNLKSGFRVSNAHVTTTASNSQLTVTLDAGKTTADFSTFGLWCETFGLDFGQTTLVAPDGSSSASSSGATTASSTGAAAATTSTKVSGAQGLDVYRSVLAGGVLASLWCWL